MEKTLLAMMFISGCGAGSQPDTVPASEFARLQLMLPVKVEVMADGTNSADALESYGTDFMQVEIHSNDERKIKVIVGELDGHADAIDPNANWLHYENATISCDDWDGASTWGRTGVDFNTWVDATCKTNGFHFYGAVAGHLSRPPQ